jgi:hypothetical protein
MVLGGVGVGDLGNDTFGVILGIKCLDSYAWKSETRKAERDHIRGHLPTPYS